MSEPAWFSQGGEHWNIRWQEAQLECRGGGRRAGLPSQEFPAGGLHAREKAHLPEYPDDNGSPVGPKDRVQNLPHGT